MRYTRVHKKAFTLVELMLVVLLSSIIVLALGVALVDGQRGYNQMYERINSEVVIGAHVARRSFDTTIRSASTSLSFAPQLTATSVKVFDYSDPNQLVPDRYSQFYVSSGTLYLEKGVRSTGTILSTQKLTENVVDVDFDVKQACIQMMLELDNGKENMIVTISSIRHNP